MPIRRPVGQTSCDTGLDETGSEGKDIKRDDERSDTVPWFEDGREASDHEQDVYYHLKNESETNEDQHLS